MDRSSLLKDARTGLERSTQRVADLILAQPDLTSRLPGSTWTLRDTAAHLVGTAALYSDVAAGTPGPLHTLDREFVAQVVEEGIADIPENDPVKLAGLITDGMDRFLSVTADRPGDQEIIYHGGVHIDLAQLAGILLAEPLLHGYDMAAAVGVPWTIGADEARWVLNGYAPILGLCLHDERTRTLTRSYRVDLGEGAGFVARFVDGRYETEGINHEPVDCVIDAEPVAFLLVTAERLTRWTAAALGLMRASERPDLGFGFHDLFIYP